jgi:hypothetical protein
MWEIKWCSGGGGVGIMGVKLILERTTVIWSSRFHVPSCC